MGHGSTDHLSQYCKSPSLIVCRLIEAPMQHQNINIVYVLQFFGVKHLSKFLVYPFVY